jgi:hypothetical protein
MPNLNSTRLEIKHHQQNIEDVYQDTNGFFIAKFEKEI